MAHVEIRNDSGKIWRVPLFKRLSVIGYGEEADIKLSPSPKNKVLAYITQLDETHVLHVPADGKAVKVNEKEVKKAELNHLSSFVIDNVQIIYKITDFNEALEKSTEEDSAHAQAFKNLLFFSEKIAKEKDIDKLLGVLLKEITSLTKAEHGFLVLLQEGKPEIRAQESLSSINQLSPMSDSIVKKVISSKKPLILNDALSDQEFSSSLSVINYRLSSVMCAPLIYQEMIFGAIYVGNNSFTSAFNEKSLELMTIYCSQAAMLVQNALHINALKKRTKVLQDSLEMSKFGGMIGGCIGMQQVFSQVEKLATTDISVLIYGETGTGKELIARELHNRGSRKDGPFVVINCGAIPENLLESELFGHVRGAFSGAVQSRVGKFQAANQGTLFLDEIGEMPLHLQVKILRVLQEHRVTKVGDNKSEPINIRVISATNRDLALMVKENTFREDLYYRLNVVQITAPPLRERGNDLLVMANYFLQKYAKIYGKDVLGLDENAQNAVLNYQWPGNVRQLENRIRRAIVMCDNQRIGVKDLDIESSESRGILSLSDALDKFKEKYIHESLERNAHNRTKTAQELGVDPRTIFRHLEGQKKDQKS